VNYGSGRKLAQDWQLKLTVDKRAGDITFADHSKSGKQNFGEACEQFIARMRVSENSSDRYLHSYRTYVRGVFGDKTLAQVAQDRDGRTASCAPGAARGRRLDRTVGAIPQRRPSSASRWIRRTGERRNNGRQTPGDLRRQEETFGPKAII